VKNKAIVTRADENIKNLTDVTHPILKKFAKEWKSDFVILDKMADCPGNGRFHYRIMEIYDLFSTYERVISLDSDVVVLPNCPNLFTVVPQDKIGTIFEDKGTRKLDRHLRIKKIQNQFGNVGWKTGYINTGVFLASQMHREIFTKINGNYYIGRGFDDVHLGYQIHKMQFSIHELNFRYNHMSMFSESWNNNANRFDSYIIHYAGSGVFDKGIKSRAEQIKKDLMIINSRPL
jgi:lipopolysaccharide biosynthesis glycosyltransferase